MQPQQTVQSSAWTLKEPGDAHAGVPGQPPVLGRFAAGGRSLFASVAHTVDRLLDAVMREPARSDDGSDRYGRPPWRRES